MELVLGPSLVGYLAKWRGRMPLGEIRAHAIEVGLPWWSVSPFGASFTADDRRRRPDDRQRPFASAVRRSTSIRPT